MFVGVGGDSGGEVKELLCCDAVMQWWLSGGR
jgi:hypothetical protein